MSNLKLYLTYHSTVKINQLYIFLRGLPLLGKRLSSSPNLGQGGKNTLSYLGLVLRLLTCVFNSAVVLAFYYLPWKFFHSQLPELGPNPASGFFQSFFFLSILAGPIMMRKGRQELDWTGYYFLKVFRFPARSFFLHRIFLNLFRIAFGLLGPMLFMGWFLGDFPGILMAYAATLLSRVFFEALTFWLYEHKGKTFWEKPWFWVSLSLLLGLLAFFPFFGEIGTRLIKGALPFSLLGALWGSFYLQKAPYDKLAAGLSSTEELAASKDLKESAHFIGVKLEEEQIESEVPQGIENKEGYAYFHQLIFHRIQNKLDKSTRRIVKIIAVLGLLTFIAGLNFRAVMAEDIDQLLMIILRASFFYSYLLSPGERFTKLLFLYMDKDLLPFHYYREPGAILQSLKIRLIKLLQLTAPITGVMLVSLLAFFGLFYQELGLKILLLIPLLLVQGAFFALYRLMVYYLLQPYTAKMEAKSPGAAIANGVVYLISFMYLQIKVIGPISLAILCVVMGLIAFSTPYILMKRGPQSFRLREG